MAQTHLISVIMPNYNKAEYIEKAIQSVLDQTYENWELIIIDNKSNDTSLDIIESQVQKDYRIFLNVLDTPPSSGVARNFGITKAKGEYIAFIDSDDIWLPKKLEKHLNYMQEQSATICSTHTQTINLRGDVVGSYRPKKLKVGYDEMLIECYLSTSAPMLKRDVIQNFEFPSLRYCQDYAFWMQLLKDKTIKADIMPEILTLHRINPSFYMLNRVIKVFYRWYVYRAFLNMEHISSFKYLYSYAKNAYKKSKGYMGRDSSLRS